MPPRAPFHSASTSAPDASLDGPESDVGDLPFQQASELVRLQTADWNGPSAIRVAAWRPPRRRHPDQALDALLVGVSHQEKAMRPPASACAGTRRRKLRDRENAPGRRRIRRRRARHPPPAGAPHRRRGSRCRMQLPGLSDHARRNIDADDLAPRRIASAASAPEPVVRPAASCRPGRTASSRGAMASAVTGRRTRYSLRPARRAAAARRYEVAPHPRRQERGHGHLPQDISSRS